MCTSSSCRRRKTACSKALLTHRSYAGLLNARRRKTGHFWQGRFGCVGMDGAHHMAALRYLLLNPVRARLVKTPEEWPCLVPVRC